MTAGHTMKPAVTPDDVIATLNEALALDPVALTLLVMNRVVCGKALANHPTIQVAAGEIAAPFEYAVGLLGVINGLFGVDDQGTGPISARVVDGQVVAFERMPGVEAVHG